MKDKRRYIEIDNPFLSEKDKAARECARYIIAMGEGASYEEYILEGNDPRQHVLYKASLVLDNTEAFEEDINNFEESS